MTENEPQAEIQGAARVEQVEDTPPTVTAMQASAALRQLVGSVEPRLRTLLEQYESEVADAEAMRQAILDALDIFTADTARWGGPGGGTAIEMAERLRQLQRVPIEVRELSQEEMVAAGFLPDAVDVVVTPRETVTVPRVDGLDWCPECDGTGWISGTTGDPADGVRYEDCPRCGGSGQVIPDLTAVGLAEARDEADADRGHDERGE